MIDFKKESDRLAVRSRVDSVSCVDLANEIEAFAKSIWDRALEEAAVNCDAHMNTDRPFSDMSHLARGLAAVIRSKKLEGK